MTEYRMKTGNQYSKGKLVSELNKTELNWYSTKCRCEEDKQAALEILNPTPAVAPTKEVKSTDKPAPATEKKDTFKGRFDGPWTKAKQDAWLAAHCDVYEEPDDSVYLFEPGDLKRPL